MLIKNMKGLDSRGCDDYESECQTVVRNLGEAVPRISASVDAMRRVAQFGDDAHMKRDSATKAQQLQIALRQTMQILKELEHNGY